MTLDSYVILVLHTAPDGKCYYFSLFTYCWSCSEVQVSSNHLNYLQEYQGTLLKPMKLGTTAPKLEKLWIYGDSQAERLHLSITDGSLCMEIFKSCNLSKMWVYPYSGQFSKWDHKDFDESIILDSLRVVLERTYMSENSVLILNLGLHYMENIRLQDYTILLFKVIDLLNERNKGTGELKHKARVVWKTSTSISKEKDTGSQLTSDRRRFLALPVSMWGEEDIRVGTFK